MSAAKPLPRLSEAQARGSDPAVHAWVSASAGAGKTQLLAARVLRLLLADAKPERILAITFTKAAAAEMQERVMARLMRWAAADEPEVTADLTALGLTPLPDLIATARTRFAAALDAGGGLRIQTLHAFAQRLLMAFPVEAGVAPGFQLLDDRSAAELSEAALDAALAEGAPASLADLAALSVRHGEEGLGKKLAALAPHGAALLARTDDEARLRRASGLPEAGSALDVLASEISRLADGDVARLAALFASKDGGKDGSAHAEALRQWLSLDRVERAKQFDLLACRFLTSERKPRARVALAGMCRADLGCADLTDRLQAVVVEAEAVRCQLDCIEVAALHFRVARVLARHRERLMADGQVLAFDDVIRKAADLLTRADAADWVRWKLDQRIDHILVDEAQDTNRDQWRIVHALSDEFFAGEGAASVQRTLFVVGDYKQSIFGFQGADPDSFAAARDRLNAMGATVRDVPLPDNYRSAPAVLDVVDRVLADANGTALGLRADADAHIPKREGVPGQVTLWSSVVARGEEDEEDSGERGWVPTAQRAMAKRLAAQVKRWLSEPLWLPARGRAVRPEDILILIRKRGAFMGPLVAALSQAGVPVAGADRLSLHAPLAAKDVKSLLRFVLQPADDLSLAEVLVSPLIGWTQDQLFEVAHGRRGALWDALRDRADPFAAEARACLECALARADWMPPSRFVESLLSLPGFEGRKRMLARLGADARDVLDELMNAAFAFEAAHPPSLTGFLHWLDAHEVDLKRDADAPTSLVRVMTVHGAKGLQAPVVVLADAASCDEQDRDGHVSLELDGIALPCFHAGSAALRGPWRDAADAKKARREQENMRLLYVALTRAEDMLFVGGAQTGGRKDPLKGTWWRRVEEALTKLGAEERPDAAPWEFARTYAPPRAAALPEPPRLSPPPLAAVPDWARQPAPAEARPPRPLAPSRLPGDDAPRPPGSADAARRGRLLHRLFERAPWTAEAARAWLAREAAELDDAEREALLAAARAVVEDPAHAALFGPDSLAEAPVAAALADGTVVAGKVDRLLVTPDAVHVVDFKTGARAPAAPHPAHVRQIAAYADALARVFPDREVRSSLLYVAGPKLVTLQPGDLAAALPGAADALRPITQPNA